MKGSITPKSSILIFQWNDECEQAFIRLKNILTSPGRQHNNADALSRTPCKVCLRHHERNADIERIY
jgi:hypothetical protein